jgi:hypothetical protein
MYKKSSQIKWSCNFALCLICGRAAKIVFCAQSRMYESSYGTSTIKKTCLCAAEPHVQKQLRHSRNSNPHKCSLIQL